MPLLSCTVLVPPSTPHWNLATADSLTSRSGVLVPISSPSLPIQHEALIILYSVILPLSRYNAKTVPVRWSRCLPLILPQCLLTSPHPQVLHAMSRIADRIAPDSTVHCTGYTSIFNNRHLLRLVAISLIRSLHSHTAISHHAALQPPSHRSFAPRLMTLSTYRTLNGGCQAQRQHTTY